MAELERRLRGRGTESPESLAVRLANAEKEMAAADNYHHLIVNDELEQAVRDLQAIIAAEQQRRNTA
ncbi:Guanylate kinase [Candidatus Electrothrix communis]|uniref:Guanylate kinase n=1 Tax=Candidatus Electrothrix communis TaxID=1859133 RepID=A0A444J6I9_9BACT|nr:Guanylate kinase [Candidatus Electrothrix communis]